MKVQATILRVIYIFSLIGASLTLIPWGAAILLHGIGLIPTSATIALMVTQIISFKQIRKFGFVQHKQMSYQIIFGIIVSMCASFIIGFLTSIDCLDICNNVPAYTRYLNGLIAFLVCSIPIVLVYMLNRYLEQHHTPVVVPVSSQAPIAPDAPQVSSDQSTTQS